MTDILGPAISKLCEVKDFYSLSPWIQAIEPHNAHRRHRKLWEYAQIARIFDYAGLLRLSDPLPQFLGVAAGIETTNFYLTRYGYVTATDQYEDAGDWKALAPNGMLINPAQYAPRDYFWIPDRLSTAHQDATALTYEDCTFDGVYCNNSIDNMGGVEQARLALHEMARVLKPGGVLALTTEYKIAGPDDGTGWDGVTVFTLALVNVLLEDTSLYLMGTVDLGLDDETRATAFPLARAVAGEDNDPHVVLTHEGYTFGSISLAFQKGERDA